MSGRAPRPAWIKLSVAFRDGMLAKLKGPELSVWLCIALHVGEDRKAFPPMWLIRRETGLARATVTKCIKHLEAMGVLPVERHAFVPDKGQKANTYTVPYFAAYGRANPVVNFSVVHGVGDTPTVQQVEPVKEEPGTNDVPTNQISEKRNPAKADRPPLKSPEKPKGPKTLIAERFAELRGVEVPNGRMPFAKANWLWWTPIREIFDLAGGDLPSALEIVETANNRVAGLEVSTPRSILKTARAMVSERRVLLAQGNPSAACHVTLE
jgi:hypothetical protein